MTDPAAADPLRDRVTAALGDRYALDAELGRGGMAVVYRATEVRLQRPVALKVLPPELAFRPGVRARFLREAQTAAHLSHPHVVPVYAAGDDGGVAWLAMALVDGETLGARMARPPRVPAAEAARVLAEVADALAYAHARGVVHRDVKPDNILLDRESGRALVTDFGIARAAAEDDRLTATGAALGTPAYMSPEQALGEGDVDGRADQYALGVVGYQLLTGVLPFQASSAAAMLMKHAAETPRPVRERAPDVPPALAAAVERALAKRPADRWPDLGAFRDAVRAAGGGAPAAATPPPPPAPQFPPAPAPLPPPGSRAEWREAQRAWKEQLRAQRRDQREEAREWAEYAREQARTQREEWREAVRAGAVPPVPAPYVPPVPAAYGAPYGAPYAAAPFPAIPLAQRADLFRRKAVGSLVLMAFLLAINATHFFVPPWFLFPWWGIAAGLQRRWRPLGAAGLSFWDVMAHGGAAAPAAPGSAGRLGDAFGPPLVLAALACVLGGVGVVQGVAPMVAIGVLLLALAIPFTASAFRRARRAGHPAPRAAPAGDPAEPGLLLEEEARRLVGDAVLAGPYGVAVREAVDDRRAVSDLLAALGPADRALLPTDDVRPTVDGLVDRVAELARRLHEVDRDAAPGALAAVDARIAEARARAGAGASGPAPERERTLQLLERQRASLADLAERRDGFAERLDSARAALRNLRLDFLKLRDGGAGALSGVGSATQEARALSRELGRALEAVDEVRRLGR